MDTNESTDPKEQEYLIWQDLYMKGDDLQKISVIQAIPKLLKTDNNATISRIIPKIQQELPNSSSEFHLVTSKMFKLLIEMDLPVNLLRPVLQGIESKDPIISNAWIDTLLAVIPSLPESSIKNEVLPATISLTHLNKAVSYRIASCRLLGQISVHSRLTPFDVKKDILPLAQSLSQDCFYEVRAAMCLELPKVAQGMGNDALVKSSLLPCLVELSTDDNMAVRAAAVDAAVLMISFLTHDTIKQTIIPLVKQLCNQSCKPGDSTFPVISRVYGLLINNLMHQFTKPESVWFLNFFMQLSKRGLTNSPAELEIDPGLGVTCREYCAYNLPAVTFFTIKIIPAEMPTWYTVFKTLAADPCYIVRKTIAGCIHEITRILGDENKCIMMDFVKLLRDEAEEVLDSLVPNIGTTLELFCMSGLLSREIANQCTNEIGRALLKCQVELFKFYNWRRNMSFLEQLERLPNCMPSDYIHQHFTSTVLKLTVEARPRPLRSQAAKTILIFLRYNTKDNHRKWICEKLITLLCCSNCCYTRHIYINTCIHAIDVFSSKYFKEHFFQSLIKLLEDPVITVRLCVVKLSPTLKRMLILPIDRNLQVKLEGALSKMETSETDKDVVATLKTKLKEMRAPHTNKQDVLFEEKRRIEEEERIQQGKLVATARFGMQESPTRQSNTAMVASRVNNRKLTTAPATSDMSFLGQHFYIDAGVALPENIKTPVEENLVDIEVNMKALKLNKLDLIEKTKEIIHNEMVVPTVSVENTNVENMSDEDLKELEISTTNITDDVKANIQKKSLSKGTPKSKLPDPVKRRNKRYSCILPADQAQSTSNSMILKRRSLNIGSQELSKIPISFRTSKKTEETTNMKKSKSGSIQSIYSTCGNSNASDKKFPNSRIKSPLKIENTGVVSKTNSKEKFVGNGNVIINSNDSCKVDNVDVNKIDVKENVPVVSDSINKTNVPNQSTKENVAKVSNLPVLVRRSASENRK